MTGQEIFAALAAPFPPDQVRTRPGKSGRDLHYITARTARSRLNDVLGPENWGCVVTPGERWVKCSITIFLDQRPITREALGGYPDMPSEEDKVKGGDCVPLDAEALTKDGWRRHDQLQLGQEILAYDMASGLCRWTPLLHINLYEDPLETIELRSKSFGIICTPNHRWVVNQRDRGVFLRETKDLRLQDILITAAPAEGGDHPLTPREAAILGWIATDGSVGYYQRKGRKETSTNFKCVITQSKEPARSTIRELLGEYTSEIITAPGTRTFPGKTRASSTRERSTFNVQADFARGLLAKAGVVDWSDLGRLAPRLSTEAREAMFRAMLEADGHHSCSGQVCFGKKRKPGVMEAFEILATLQGVALGIRRASSSGKLVVRTLRRLDHTHAKCLDCVPSEPIPVWCPTTALGTWVMRWRDTIAITSNSDAFKRACSLFGIGEYLYGDEAHHDDGRGRGLEHPPRAAHASAPDTGYRPTKQEVGGWYDRGAARPQTSEAARPQTSEAARPRALGWPKDGGQFYAWIMNIKDKYAWPSIQAEITENFVTAPDYKYPQRFKDWDGEQVGIVAQWVAAQCASTDRYQGEFNDHLGVAS